MVLAVVLAGLGGVQAQQTGPWRGSLLREDGKSIHFHFDIRSENGKQVLYIINANERLRVDKLVHRKDSLFIEMPVFESRFRVRKLSPTQWQGVWIKEGSVKQQVMPFTAATQQSLPPEETARAITDISGRWSVSFTHNNAPAVGEWQQKGNTLRGTVLTPTGDYRYLSGVLDGDSLRLSTFDGSHAFLFTAKVESDQKISGGLFYSGATSVQPWEAVKNPDASLPDLAAMHLKDGESKLNFRFRDLTGKMVSINDPKFRNKVVIVQIMGSWCPNCMDETAFLSEFYNRNRQRGVEVIGLAYEYSTDWERSRKSIQKFKDRFQVKYTLLNTGVTVTDSLRTEKTLPQLTPIKSFPSTIFLDRKGRVAKLHAGFEGPGTGEHYEALKKDFAATVDRLLKEGN
ncbi:peroxiredoxin family protein [Sediminibacterium soli]|uniref:peroxiredoxin family protein n=1 Tax=Sediminibacterium soli TaxID=2698829 RepID=UPI001F3BE889|nr:TlpA disulfide reductase family protein [Sediminibacterium soli]